MNYKIQWFEQLKSTNNTLADILRESPETLAGTVIATHSQTGGRGRMKRKWMSSPGQDLTFSVLIRCKVPDIYLASLPMCAALAINSMLQKSYNIKSRVKWPNDVLVGKSKICGILSEKVNINNTETVEKSCILGIGLNINMEVDSARLIDRPATSVYIESNQKYSPESVLETLLGYLPEWLDPWEHEGFAGISEQWIRQSGGLGQPISVHDRDQKTSGVLAGFGEHGQLLLGCADGNIKTVWSGDVTPRTGT